MMTTAFTVTFTSNGNDNGERHSRSVPSRALDRRSFENGGVDIGGGPPGDPLMQSTSGRGLSRAQRDRRLQAENWHAQLMQMEKINSKMISKQIKFLSKEQDVMKQFVVKAMVETKLLESFIEHLFEAQRDLAHGMKIGFEGCYKEIQVDPAAGINLDSLGVSTIASTSSVAAMSIEKGSRLMIHKIERLGVTTLHEVLQRVRDMFGQLHGHHHDLQQVGRAAMKALEESQLRVHESWEKYYNDAIISRNARGMDPPSFSGSNSSEDVAPCFPARQLPARKSSFKSVSSSCEPPPPVRGLTRKSSIREGRGGPLGAGLRREPSQERRQGGRRSLSRERQPLSSSRRVNMNRNGSLRAMANAADLTAATTDVWLSEWSYRAHIMEQNNLWEQAARRMQKLFKDIKTLEVKRRMQFRKELMLVIKNQQRLAVNLEAASTLGLMDFWEAQQEINEEVKEDKNKDDNEKKDEVVVERDVFEFNVTYGASGHRTMTDTAKPSILPPFAKSGYVTMTALAKRVPVTTEGDPPSAVLAMIVVTTDGLLYFFDLPNDCNIPFSKSSSEEQVWQAVMKTEFKRRLTAQNNKRDGSDFVVEVPPPIPSRRLVLSQCSVEMSTNADCAVKISVPETLGGDLRIELTSMRHQIAFIDAFHASKFKDDGPEFVGDEGETDSISDVSCTEYDDEDGEIS